MTRLTGQIVLVTGANGGLGTEFVRQALERGATKVYAAARRPQDWDDARIVPLVLDVGDAASVARAATEAADVTVVVNNAGCCARAGSSTASSRTSERRSRRTWSGRCSSPAPSPGAPTRAGCTRQRRLGPQLAGRQRGVRRLEGRALVGDGLDPDRAGGRRRPGRRGLPRVHGHGDGQRRRRAEEHPGVGRHRGVGRRRAGRARGARGRADQGVRASLGASVGERAAALAG